MTWSELEAGAPEIAAAARELFQLTDGPAGLGYLATVRRDGGPRVHPISPALLDDQLFAFVLKRTPKCRDLHRDGRYALHSWPRPFPEDEAASWDDEEILLIGTAYHQADDETLKRVAATVGDDPATGDVFVLAIATAMHKLRRGGLRHAVWRNPVTSRP